MSLESWDDIIGELSRAHRVLRYDLRGFGLSEKLRGAVTIEDEVDDLRGLLDHLGIAGPVTLVGGAVGGAIALRFAAAQPQRVAAVMALSPSGDVAPSNRPAYLARAARLERFGARSDVDATRDDTYSPTLRTGHEDRFARFLALQYANDPVSMAATLRMIAITEWAATWPAIQCPAWFVAVSRYKARPIESVKSMASAVRRGHFEVLDTGPFVPVQSPELLLPLLRTFLEATGR
jgi:3-oxoadipate enol-lactonase